MRRSDDLAQAGPLNKRAAQPQANSGATAPPLWQQLSQVAVFLQAVRAGQSSTQALLQTAPQQRAGVQALGFAVLRQLGLAQVLRGLLVKTQPSAAADALLCSALALAVAGPAYDEHTLVNQAVEAAKRSRALLGQANFINACLRRFLRERAALMQEALRDPQAQWNHPRWWVERLRCQYPQHWQQILQANNSQAPMSLRVNGRKQSLASYLSELNASGNLAFQNGAHGLTLHRACAVTQLPGFAQGHVSVQDGAAQRAAPLLLGGLVPAGPRLRLLDACAAPGGKTAHLLECVDPATGADVLALDVDAQRCERIHDNLQRLGLQAQVVVADAAQPHTWWDGQWFDGILLDAPCTASGIVRRHPDVRWLRRESDIAQLAATQHRLLQALWPLLRPGGHLLYATCSVFHEEGAGQVQTFLLNNSNAVLRPSPGHLLPLTAEQSPEFSDNGLHERAQVDQDGFFYALLQKQ